MINKFLISIILFIMPSLAFSAKNVKYIECDYTETVVANVSHKPHKLLKLIDRDRGIFERKGKIIYVVENDKIFTLNQYFLLLYERETKSSNSKPKDYELTQVNERLPIVINEKFIAIFTEKGLYDIFAFNSENDININPLIRIRIDRVTGTYKSSTILPYNGNSIDFEQNGTCKGHNNKTRF